MTKTKQFGTFMTSCHPIVEEFASNSTNLGMLPISFASSVVRGPRRTLKDVIGAIDSAEAGPTVEEECFVHKVTREFGQISYKEASGATLDSKLLAGAIKEALMFMRKLQVCHESSFELLDQVWVKIHARTMGPHEQG